MKLKNARLYSLLMGVLTNPILGEFLAGLLRETAVGMVLLFFALYGLLIAIPLFSLGISAATGYGYKFALLLLALLFVYSIPLLPGPKPPKIRPEETWHYGCGMWRIRGCKLEDVNEIRVESSDLDQDGKPDELSLICSAMFNVSLGNETTPNTARFVAGDPESNPCWR